MAQKFVSLEDAAKQLSVSKDRLNQLREAGTVRAYRDGASWKFRGEDIDKLASEGIPPNDPEASDLALDMDDDADAPPLSAAAASDMDLALADEPSSAEPPATDLSLEEEEMAAGPASDLSLDEVDEPTVAGDEDDDALALDDDDSIDFAKDSILLSEAELGGSVGRPPSTIIGKAELDLDADLDLSPSDSAAQGPASDVKLATESDILPAADDELAIDLPSPSGDFEDLEELEVDLEAESSRILTPDDLAEARATASAAASKSSGLSDLELAPTPSDLGRMTSDIGVGGDLASGTGLTGLSALELDDEGDDEVLGEGSDVTLSGESSGINIISPSDSGLALDEVPLDLSGSAGISSSLDLGDSVADEVSLEPLAIGSGVSESQIGGDFQLTPLGEEEADDEKDSSQVIALDDLSEDTAGAPLGVGAGDAGMLADDFGVGLAPGAVPIGVVSAADTPFSVWNVTGLLACLVLLLLCGMLTFDLLRNMWSWDGVANYNSSLLEVLNPFL